MAKRKFDRMFTKSGRVKRQGFYKGGTKGIVKRLAIGARGRKKR